MTRKYSIPLSHNAIDHQVLQDVLLRYEGQPHAEIVHDFETQVSRSSGAPFVLATSSGTAALHLALRVLGVQPGDRVIVPTFTYVASVNPIAYCGAEPVFIDVEPDTWNMNPDLLDQALTGLAAGNQLPKAIIVVHIYGNPARMSLIMNIANRWNIPVIEDAAEAVGATYKNKWVGTFGDLGIFSFNNNKSITTFGGGALISKKHKHVETARYLANHAKEAGNLYQHDQLGYYYLMGPLNAAYGLSQWINLNVRLEERRALSRFYREQLSNLGVGFQVEPESGHSSRWLTSVRIPAGIEAASLIQWVENEGIELRRVWLPIHSQIPYLRFQHFLDKTSEKLFERGVCLPFGKGGVAGQIVERLRYRLQQVFKV